MEWIALIRQVIGFSFLFQRTECKELAKIPKAQIQTKALPQNRDH
jgi:hypothetical protein